MPVSLFPFFLELPAGLGVGRGKKELSLTHCFKKKKKSPPTKKPSSLMLAELPMKTLP